MQLEQFLANINAHFKAQNIAFTVLPEHVSSGFVRADVGGRGNFWVRIDTSRKTTVCAWGDFRTGEQGHLFMGEENSAALKRIHADWKKEKARQHEHASLALEPVWQAALPAGRHPYLDAKAIRLHGARLSVHAETDTVENVLVPMRLGPKGRIENLQQIDANGNKALWPGAQTHAVHFWIGAEKPTEVIVCEGYATGASIYEALGEPTELAVVCAMSGANLTAATAYVLKAHPSARVRIAADNDHGKSSNAGITYATKAASLSSKIRIIHPPAEDGVSDFNDLALKHGRDALVGAFEDAPSVITSELIDARPKKPNENQIAELLARELKNACVHETDVFEYTGTHWIMWRDTDHVRLNNQIRALSGGQYKTGDVRSCKQAVLDRLPRIPEGLLSAKKDRANFKNGTLHLLETKEGPTFHFREHNPQDGMMSLFPFDFSNSLFEARSEAWESYVRSLFAHEPDCDEKVQAIAEMYGAMLMPKYPHLFMLHGGASCGKSTIINTGLKLTREEDVGGVDPTKLGREFYLEPLLGKTINAVTDICTNQPIADDIVKQIEDQNNFYVNRKGQRAIMAPLPPIHIFGGNGIPKTLDGASGAHERRWTFLEFTKRVADNDNYERDFASRMFRENFEGILGFALRGLLSLLKRRGIYTQPASGKETMREWQKGADAVAQFLDAIELGELKDIHIDPAREIPATPFFAAFKGWADATNSGARMSQTAFGLRLKKLGIQKRRSNTGVYIQGFYTTERSPRPLS